MNNITPTDIDTKVYQLLDKDVTLLEDDSISIKRVLQYNPISKLYIVIKCDMIQKINTILCITSKQTVASKLFNEAFK